MNQRQQLEQHDLESAILECNEKMWARAKQKGMGCFASSHEILGYTHDEVQEFRDTVHSRMSADAKVQELIDIAVCAIWGIASIRSGAVDW